MTTIHAVRSEIETLRVEARGLVEPAGSGDSAATTRFTAIEARVAELQTTERRLALVDDLDRRAAGQPIEGSGDANFDRLVDGVGLLDVIRAQMPGVTDAAAGRAREVSAELARRSGRKVEGLLWRMPTAETRTLTTALPVTGPGSNIIPNVYRGDLFIDRLRNATKVRALGATVLGGLTGNITIPSRTASVVAGWTAENTPFPVSDPAFGNIAMSPKHAGVISEWSRNLVLQSSPDVEALARDDMAKVLAELLDSAAIAGTGQNAQPTGILNTPGIGLVSAGTNGGALTYDMVADLIGAVDDANADGSTTGFLTNTRVRRALSKLKSTTGEPLGLDTVLQGKTAAYSNLMSSTGTKGTGTGLSSVIYGDWSCLMIGLWSELDILVNPYESAAYSKGNISVRAAMSVDIAVRHAASFGAITDVIA